MKVINTLKEWEPISRSLFLNQKSLGFVPTMGALHRGHLSLAQRSLRENDKTVVSIFLNSTQFDKVSDLEHYPVKIEKDKELLRENAVDYVFCPQASEIYSDHYRFRVYERDLSGKLCGAYRKNHFEGVLTVVLKLFHILKPQRAYFGEKDYQQYLLIQDMVKSFFLEIEVLVCPTLREKNGLAMSSRNLRLSEEERKKASVFFEILKENQSRENTQRRLKEAGFEVEYVEDFGGRRFAAIYFKEVRLIDNVII